jgi:hypothetical protein
MTLRTLCIAVMVLVDSLHGGGATSRPLEGCPEPSATAAALARLERVRWATIDVAGLRRVWPDNLDGLDCVNGRCSSLWSKGRIISGHCECCATFFFDEEKHSRAAPGQRLGVVVVNYSAGSFGEVVSAGRKFAASIGVPADEVATIGASGSRDFSWDGNSLGETALLKVSFRHQASVWTVTFYLSHP